MNLSPHFTLAELIQSETAARRRIDNTPNATILHNLGILAAKLEAVREVLGGLPMLISSGYRCPALNKAVGGAGTSAHMDGLAADFICPGFGTPLEVCKKLAQYAEALGFDQVIQEGTWVHVGFAAEGKQPRRQVLTANFKPGGVTYVSGLA